MTNALSASFMGKLRLLPLIGQHLWPLFKVIILKMPLASMRGREVSLPSVIITTVSWLLCVTLDGNSSNLNEQNHGI